MNDPFDFNTWDEIFEAFKNRQFCAQVVKTVIKSMICTSISIFIVLSAIDCISWNTIAMSTLISGILFFIIEITREQ